MSNPAASEAGTTWRRASAFGLNQVVQLLGGWLFVLFVPRMLGPELYGQLAYAFAFTAVFQMLGELGYQEIFSRFVPEVRAQGGDAAVRQLARELFAVKLGAGLLLGLAALFSARLFANWLSWADAGLIGLSVVARAGAMTAFPLLLGLGQAHKWSVEVTWRPVVVLALLLLGFQAKTLTVGLVALAAHEILFVLLGVYWARDHLLGASTPASATRGGIFVPKPVGLLRFGLTFAAANLALAMLFRIGPLTVQWLTGSSSEVGYFDLALGAVLLVYTLFHQLSYTLTTVLTELRLSHRDAEADAWLARFVRYTTVLAVLAAGGIWAMGKPAIPALFGSEYEPVIPVLYALAWGVVPLPIAWAGAILTTVEKRPRHKVRAALFGLLVFLIAAWSLRAEGTQGIALSFSLALLAFAVGYGQDALRAVRAGGVSWLIALGAAGAFGLLTVLPPAFYGLIPWAVSAGLYLALALVFRVVPLGEVQSVLRAIRR